jgi:prepilin-type N-terminal cleavage/methylation domain-containing protein
MKDNRKRTNAFTLIELLIAVSILAVIMSSLYTSFVIGLRAHRRTEEQLIQKNSGDIFIIQLERELRNSIPYFHPNLEHHFLGKGDSLIFPAQIVHYSSEGIEEGLSLIRYEKEGNSLVRTEEKLREKSIGKDRKQEILFDHLETFRFEYLTLSSAGEFLWRKEWPNQPYIGLPRAVRFTISGDVFGKEMKTIEILIPQGVLLKSHE